MQIIAGTHKGRKLYSLPGKEMRPTSGKVREAVFAILSDSIIDACILDLFAGTGAYGLEAISRGAEKAVFVESDRQGVEVIRKNIDACKEGERSTVVCADARSNLNFLKTGGLSFDLVFMDPPYNRQIIMPALENLVGMKIMEKNAIVIIEHDKKEEIGEEIAGLEIIDRRKYGKTLVTFMQWIK